MVKRMIAACLTGAAAGIALAHLIALTLSLWLNLGYFAPTFSSLPEQVGGELNAVLIQTALCALLGAALGAARTLARWKPWPAGRWALWALADMGVFLLVAAGVWAGVTG